MAFTELRSYLKARLADTDSALREHKDGFNRDNIGRNILNKSYFITLSNPANFTTENCIVDDFVDAKVEIFFRGGKTSGLQAALDAATDLGHNFKLRAVNHTNFTGGIKIATSSSVKPEPFDTNDNSIIISVEFTFRMVFSVL